MKINQELLTYVQQNVQKYEDRLLRGEKVDGPAVIEPGQHLTPDLFSPPYVGDYVHPHIIIWDPLQQHQHCFKNGLTCPHYEHGHLSSILTPCKWKDGKSERDFPRQIYSVSGPVLLVSRVYRSLRTADAFPVAASLPPKNSVCDLELQNDFRDVIYFLLYSTNEIE